MNDVRAATHRTILDVLLVCARRQVDGNDDFLAAGVADVAGLVLHVSPTHSLHLEAQLLKLGHDAFSLIALNLDSAKPLVATAGMFANMPVGVPHSFKNESGKPAKMLISVAPAGLEKMFFEFGVPLADGATTALPPSKEEIEKLLKIAQNYGIQILLPKH
jgi:hypothetical protein